MAKNNPLTRVKHRRALEAYRAHRLQDAKEIYLQIVGKDRADDFAWVMLGITHAWLNELDSAESSLQRAVDVNPLNFDALYNLGRAQFGRGRLEQALVSYQNALHLKPDHIETLLGLGLSSAGLEQWTRAQAFYEQILEHDPKHAAALNNLAGVMRSQGAPEQAIPYYRRALASNPLAETYSNLLLCLHYPAVLDAFTVFQEHLAWGASLAKHHISPGFPQTERTPDKPLRIGYVTPDLRCHSVAYFIEPLLAHHDRSQFELFCYLELGMADETTRRLLEYSGTVKNTCGLADDQVAEIIRADMIDILVDLAGHTSKNRLPVFARKPAPIQITYLGYPNTTGLSTMDYRFTDEWADPVGTTEHLHTEKLLRLQNGFLCFMPPAESPEISPLPCIDWGYITFGSFNALPKITDAMLKVWAKIVLGVPNSRLLIKNAQLTDTALQKRLCAALIQYGVPEERLKILGRTSKEEHMAALSRVDIALDSFPYHGTTTTCDTLWMGVPVITLAGKSHVSRVGVSLLSRLGLTECIADSVDEYIEIAIRLASSFEALNLLRQNMRSRFVRSGLCDGFGFTRNVESVYRWLWQEWCKTVKT